MSHSMGSSNNVGCLTFAWIFFVTWMLGSEVMCVEPDTMARPTRPKIITDVDELRKYLDLVRDFYTVNSKARYGKRGVIPAIIVHNRPHTHVIIDSLMKRLDNAEDKHQLQENSLEEEVNFGEIKDDNQVDQVDIDKKQEIILNKIRMRVLLNSVLRKWLHNFKV
ncbi:uncharacterized protein LOC130670860 [Microplitis mediator]|uniref:uncharacterized protein LOC130670860 n=1 Tax=Microplitis mediator TaxID=375433 RepID=UPI002555B08D|nr:uncharacterized protein LOC130670860 [Microplitis mediator]